MKTTYQKCTLSLILKLFYFYFILFSIYKALKSKAFMKVLNWQVSYYKLIKLFRKIKYKIN